ncbi:hypothetical protein NHX12_009560 [Muraenolepis orangiensis]|uniref:Uncharacterized protein n=1 Tax=Muraenolepis orangiensis TaxID=630683 RepID=A0A9Q0DJG4_9TELE|nr:hypothetical protein NHX12_009560 [Muraenolepis orangiensis]
MDHPPQKSKVGKPSSGRQCILLRTSRSTLDHFGNTATVQSALTTSITSASPTNVLPLRGRAAEACSYGEDHRHVDPPLSPRPVHL